MTRHLFTTQGMTPHMTSRPENQAPRAPHLALVPRSRKPVARILPFPPSGPSAPAPAGSRPDIRRADPPPANAPFPPAAA